VRGQHARVGGGDGIDIHGRSVLHELQQVKDDVLRQAGVAGDELRAHEQALFAREIVLGQRLQNGHVGHRDQHVALLVENGDVGRGGAALGRVEVADVHARGQAFLADLLGVDVGADRGDELDAAAQPREIFAHVARDAAGGGIHTAGVAVLHDDGRPGPAVDVDVGRADAHHVKGIVHDVALSQNIALLLQIGDVHGD